MKSSGKLEKYYYHSFPMHAVLVTVNDLNEKTNAITIAWHTPISRKPPLYGISVAPMRFSHQLINQTEEFVINFLPFEFSKKIHYCGTHSGKKIEKLKNIGLNLEPANKIKTPHIKEGYAHLECKLNESITIGDHTLFVGQVVYVSGLEKAFSTNILDSNVVKPSFYLGDNFYTTIAKIKEKF